MHDGISSTGLHPEQYHRYHFATHYFDALIFRVLDLNVFTEYSKLGVIKALSFVPLTIIFCKNHHTQRSLLEKVFLTVLAFFMIVGGGALFSSYPLWLPSLSLILSWPYVMRVMEKPDSRLLVLCFLITIFTYFGKVSAGFSFSVFVCSMLLLKHYREYKAWVFKISSFVFLMIFYLMFWRIEVSSSQTFSFTDLSYSIFSDAVFSIIIVIIVTFMSSFSVGKVIGVCLSFATVSISAVAASNSDNDVYYFMQSLTFILSLYALSLLLKSKASHEQRRLALKPVFKISDQNKFSIKSTLPLYNWFIDVCTQRQRFVVSRGAICTVIISLVVSFSSSLPLFSPIYNLKAINLAPFNYHNANSEVDDFKSIKNHLVKSFKHGRIPTSILSSSDENYAHFFYESVLDVRSESANKKALLFISESKWKELSNIFSTESIPHLVIHLSALLPADVTFLNAVPDLKFNNYGFRSYDVNAKMREEFGSEYCGTDYEIILLTNVHPPEFQAMAC